MKVFLRGQRRLLVSLLLVLCVAASVSRLAAEDGDPLQPLAWLAGGKWVAEAKGPNGEPMIRESFFEWAANRKALRFWSVVKLQDGRTLSYVEGMYGWHPGRRELVFWYFDAPGGYYHGVVKVDGNKLDHFFEGVNTQGETKKWRYWLVQDGAERMPIKIFRHHEGEWVEKVNLLYERQR